MLNWRSKDSNKKSEQHQRVKSITEKQTDDDQHHRHKLNPSSIQWERSLDREFRSLDIDADGYVSRADLQCVLRNFSHVCNSNEIMWRIFEEVDLNHDQRISKQEFQLYKTQQVDRSISLDQSPSIFTLFDRNHDNFISPHEIRETMKNLGVYIDDCLVHEMMQTADMDHDGRISREEFEKLLHELHQN